MNVALLFLALSAFVFNAVVGDDAVPEYKILAHQTVNSFFFFKTITFMHKFKKNMAIFV